MTAAMVLTSQALPDRMRLVGFRGKEALSRPYAIDVYLVAPDAGEFELGQAIGGKATLAIDRDDGRDPFHIAGIVASMRLLNQMRGSALYHAVLVPRLTLLAHTRKSRVFTKKKVPEILRAVLADGGIGPAEMELRLRGEYEIEEHVAQYQESDLDFFHRWIEHEGIYYFFEHGEHGEKLILTDDHSAHVPLDDEPLRYHPVLGDDRAAGESLSRFSVERRALPVGVRVADYDYAEPSVDLSAGADVSATGIGQVVWHGARCFSVAAAERYAKLRAEELLAREVVAEGRGTTLYVRPGYLVDLEDHPREELNDRWLVTEVTHEGSQDRFSPDGEPMKDVYRVAFSAIPAQVQFRPRRLAPWPHVYGIEGGVIDGPMMSDYAQIDDHGRYAVKFLFDQSPLKDGKASTWVRMAQPHGGAVEGFHFPLRKGTEVMFSFLGGDPDRPVIVGVAPNAQNPSLVTSANHTTNMIQTGGRNRIEIEDYDGRQRVTVYSPIEESMLRMGSPNDDTNLLLTTTGNAHIEAGGACGGPAQLAITTVGPKDERVEGTVTEEYAGPFETTVTGATEEHYGAKKKETVGQALVEEYGTQTTTVFGDLTEEYESQSTTVHGARVETCDADVDEEYAGPLDTTVTNAVSETFGGTYNLEVKGPMLHQVAGNISRFMLSGFERKSGGDKSVETGSSVKIILGVASETIIGASIELLGGAKIESVLGLAKENNHVLKVEAHAAGEIGVHPVSVEKREGVFKMLGTEMHNIAGAAVKMAGAVRTRLGGLAFKN